MKSYSGGGPDQLYLHEIMKASGNNAVLDDKSDINEEDTFKDMEEYVNVNYDSEYGSTYRHQGFVIFISIRFLTGFV